MFTNIVEKNSFAVILPCNLDNEYLYTSINSVIEDVPSNCMIYIIVHKNRALFYKLCTKYNSFQIVIYHDEYSEFLGGVLNFAISMVKEKYIFRMDSDDIWLKGRFKLQSTYIMQNPDVDILSGSLEIINKDGVHLYNIIRNLTPIEFHSKLKYACVIAHPTVLFKKNSVLKYGGYSMKLAATEDFDLWARMRKGSKIIGLSDLVIKHRLHSESVSAKKTEVQLNENLHIVARENLTLAKFFSIDCSRYQHKYRSKFLCKTFFQYFRLKRKLFIIIKKYEKSDFKKVFEIISV